MATRTLSVSEEAYQQLVRARLNAKESFSKVIIRARWNTDRSTCGGVLRKVSGRVSDQVLDTLDAAQREDQPPEDSWAR